MLNHRPTLALLTILVVSTALYAAAPVREWTILVYLNADNSLDPFGPKDLAEMQKVGSAEQVNVVVQMDRQRIGAKRYFVRKGQSDVLADLGPFDMGDYKNLVAFAKWGSTEYPSRRTMLIVWNHGSGWDKRRARNVIRGVSYDDGSGNHISTDQLGLALAQIAQQLGRKVDILGFDACLMNMFEVSYEVKDSVGLMVGSEETEPGDGWAYQAWLAKLVASPTMSTRQLATIVCETYVSSYWVQKATLSAIFCAALDRLRAKTDDLVTSMLADSTGDAKQALSMARQKVARFAVADNADFFDLLALFKGAVKSPALRAAAAAVLADEGVAISANAVHGFPLPLKNVHGLAVYFPKAGGWWGGYKRLAFAKASQWDEMLQSLFGRPREGNGPFEALWGSAQHRD